MANARFGEDALTGSLIGLAFAITLAVLIVVIWLWVRAIHCIVSAFVLRPRSRALWGLVGLLVLSVLLGAATGLPAFGAVTWLTFFVLLITARAVVISHRETFQEEYSTQDYVHEVLREWWPSAA